MSDKNSTRAIVLAQPVGPQVGLPAVLYVLDPKQAAEHLIAGRCLGICKVCHLEFRVPANFAEWPAFIEGMVRHPLEHDRSEETKRRADEILSWLRVSSPEAAEVELAVIFASHLEELAACGALVKVRRDR